MMLHTPKALQLTWDDAAQIVQAEIQKIIGREIQCEAHSDDTSYWCISFPLERMPLSELHRILDDMDAATHQRMDSIPPKDDYADSVNSLGMDASNLLLQRGLGYKWQSLHLDEEYIWVLGEAEPDDGKTEVIKIADKYIPMTELKSRQEVMEYLYENGPTHAALMDMCEEYRQKYQNELCWAYPISDGKHLGTFMLLVEEGILSIPYDDADKVDYELFCMDDVCLFDLESMELLISDWYSFDVDLRRAMADMKRYLQKVEVQNED